MQAATAAVLMRGGTSKGLYFHAGDLPADTAARDRLLLCVMGSPDLRQVDGVGGAHPLTSKVAVISKSVDPAADVDYLFLQVHVDEARVSDSQNCGNILAGVGPFAIEQGIVPARDGKTVVRIRMLNSGGIAVATVRTPGGRVTYAGEARIDGVPGTAAPIMIDFADVAGSSCGALLPTANAVDEACGVRLSCVDSGMPVVILRAADFGVSGEETPAELEANAELKERLEAIRLEIGPRMNLGDVRSKTVPKLCLVAPPAAGGIISTRTFIPHRVHQAIGVLGAASVAAACRIPGSVAADVSRPQDPTAAGLDIEHPTGRLTVDIEIGHDDGIRTVRRAALLRTARKLMEGTVFMPADPEQAA